MKAVSFLLSRGRHRVRRRTEDEQHSTPACYGRRAGSSCIRPEVKSEEIVAATLVVIVKSSSKLSWSPSFSCIERVTCSLPTSLSTLSVFLKVFESLRSTYSHSFFFSSVGTCKTVRVICRIDLCQVITLNTLFTVIRGLRRYLLCSRAVTLPRSFWSKRKQ